jgi:hypothetical protein
MSRPGFAKAAPASARVLAAGALAAAGLALGGCATVVLGVHEPFQVISSPAGAHVELSSGETCVTPCTLQLPRAVSFKLRISLPGYVTQMIPVASHTSVGGAVGFVGNGVIGGIIGAGADMDSGALRSLSPNPVKVRLDPLPPPPKL